MATKQAGIMTVRGKISAAEMGLALCHEHLLVDFVGASQIVNRDYDQDEAFQVILPHLAKLRWQNVGTLVECTPQFLGRSPQLFRRLSEASGIQILTNTGLYAAGERGEETEPFLPEYADRLSAEQLSGAWLKEWFDGIEGTSIRPGFIKIGVNPGRLRPISRKIVRAAALTSRESNLATACHTVKAVAALEALDIFESERVSPEKFIFVHAQGEDDLQLLAKTAERGAWIELDGVGPDSAEEHLAKLRFLIEKGFEEQVLLSQDAGWYTPGEPGGGRFRGYTFLVAEFLPLLRSEGVPSGMIEQILVHNPARAFSVTAF